MEKIYKFKNAKHSVYMKFIMELETESGKKWIMENKDYKGLDYIVYPDELEEVK